jgi:hypothetical protein
MSEPLIVKHYTRTCTACPSQWEGTLEDGRSFYARYRWSSFGFGVGATLDDAVAACVYVEGEEEGLNGFIKDSDMKEWMIKNGFDMSTAKLLSDPVEDIF